MSLHPPIRDVEVATFVLRRLMGTAGNCGRSSDALIATAASGGVDVPEGMHPRDTDDLARCCEAFKLAPWKLREAMLPILARWTADLAADQAARKAKAQA